jgi:hypothetical protein
MFENFSSVVIHLSVLEDIGIFQAVTCQDKVPKYTRTRLAGGVSVLVKSR